MPVLSRFNHFQPLDSGEYLAFSAQSGAVAVMTPENYAVYMRIAEKLNNDPEAALDGEEAQLMEQLRYGNFALPTGFDEHRMLQFRHNMDRYGQASMSLVIAPTMACNMACTYCFEGNKTGRMAPEVVDAVEQLVADRAVVMGQLDVTWYGGEPLLAMDTVTDLTGRFLRLSEKHGFRYSSSMISNGYLLTPDVVKQLVEFKVGSVQVTLDGPARIHDTQRPLMNGKPSFDRILENIKHAVEHIPVVVRVNIDKNTRRETIEELLGVIAETGLRERLKVYFGAVFSSTSVCADLAETCHRTLEFSQIEIEYYRLLLDKGFSIDKLPAPTSACCAAQRVNAFIVGPDGSQFRCLLDVGDLEKSSGRINDVVDYQHKNFLKLFDFVPFDDQVCVECSLLPVCMGGCPADRVNGVCSREDLCPTWKHNLEPMLMLIAQSRQQQMRKNQTAATAAKE